MTGTSFSLCLSYLLYSIFNFLLFAINVYFIAHPHHRLDVCRMPGFLLQLSSQPPDGILHRVRPVQIFLAPSGLIELRFGEHLPWELAMQ